MINMEAELYRLDYTGDDWIETLVATYPTKTKALEAKAYLEESVESDDLVYCVTGGLTSENYS